MLDRSAIQARARAQFKQRYWPLMGVLFTPALISAVASMFMPKADYTGMEINMTNVVESAFSFNAVQLLGNLLMTPLTLLLQVGTAYVCLKIYRGEEWVYSDLFESFGNFKRNFLAMLAYNLAGVATTIPIWLIVATRSVPLYALAIIATIALSIWVSYSLYFVPYLLADSTEIQPMEALKLSLRMTKGYKLELLFLQLIFVLYWVLSLFTLMIAGIFYVAPYESVALAGFYDEVRTLNLDAGTVFIDELE